MSKFIKLFPVFLVICLVSACGPTDTYKYFSFDEFFYDDTGALTISYEANRVYFPDAVKKYIKLNTDTYQWETSTATGKTLADEQITTSNGQTIIKDGSGAVVFEQPVPSISDIESQTDISLPNAEAYYNYFRTGNDYLWDRETIVVNVGINKTAGYSDDYNFTGIHSFLATYDTINSLWTIQHSGKIPGDLFDSGALNINNDIKFSSYGIGRLAGRRPFVDSNISLCQSWLEDDTAGLIFDKSIKCVVKYDNGEVSLQKLYGEILPVQYADVLSGMEEKGKFSLPADSRVFFDESLTMYVLYNHAEEAKGEYFYFEMYKPNNPTVTQHKQKIYR